MEEVSATRDIDIAWAAGLFEGEGCLNISGKYGVRFTLKMSDKDIVERWTRIMGAHLYGPYQPAGKSTYLPMWESRIADWKGVLEAISLLYPLAGIRRREKMDFVLSKAPEHPKGTVTLTLACPPEPVDSYLGYSRHRYLGIPPCDICKASANLYVNNRKRARREANKTDAERRIDEALAAAGIHPDEVSVRVKRSAPS